MTISQPLLDELKIIIKQDYGVELQPQIVVDVANTLVGYFELLAKIDCRCRQPVKSDYDNDKQSNQN